MNTLYGDPVQVGEEDGMGYRAAGRPQQVTRVPPYRPGMWVRVAGDAWRGAVSKVRRVKSLTCSITSPDQTVAAWRVHFDDGRSTIPQMIDRLATREEALAAEAAERRLP